MLVAGDAEEGTSALGREGYRGYCILYSYRHVRCSRISIVVVQVYYEYETTGVQYRVFRFTFLQPSPQCRLAISDPKARLYMYMARSTPAMEYPKIPLIYGLLFGR